MRYLELYHDYLLFERNLSKATITTYETQLSFFLNYLEERKMKVETCKTENIRQYLMFCSQKGDGDRTIALIITVLKSFYRYLNKDGLVKSNPTLKIEQNKPVKHIPNTLTTEKVEKIINVIDDSTAIGFRDKAMIEFMFSTGCRISELTELKINQLTLSEAQVHFIGKGNKERLGFLGDISINLMSKYMITYRKEILKDRQSNYVFVGKINEKLNRSYILTLVKKYAKMAGINKEISPHTFRHSYATALLENDADLITVKTLLGHSNIDTTQIYTHVSKQRLKDVYNKAHPLGNEKLIKED